jgi:hypothetical protein
MMARTHETTYRYELDLDIEAPRARLYRARSRRFEAATVRWSNHGDGKQKLSYSG